MTEETYKRDRIGQWWKKSGDEWVILWPSELRALAEKIIDAAQLIIEERR
jgi:hypothetical protein